MKPLWSCFEVGQKFQREFSNDWLYGMVEIWERRWVRRGWEVGLGWELEKWGFGQIGDPSGRNFDSLESSKFKAKV
jgi:hypothetical protein